MLAETDPFEEYMDAVIDVIAKREEKSNEMAFQMKKELSMERKIGIKT